MKVLIDIPNNKLEWIRKKVYPNYIDNAIKNGIVLDGLTNGEVLAKMFPSLKITVGAKNMAVYIDDKTECLGAIDFDWWNRKWGE